MYYQFPLESLARLRDSGSQLEFARGAREALADREDVAFEASERGLAIFAANEEALAAPTRLLQDLYGENVDLRGPRIRYIPGTPLQEPIMHVRVSASREWAHPVVSELKLRQGRILEECVRGRQVVVRAEVALALLLGFPALLDELTRGQASCTVRLARYVPLARRDPLRKAA